jgi:hypothetical protein
MNVFGRLFILVIASLAIFFPAHAQIDWRLLDSKKSIADSFSEGVRDRQDAERRKLEIENIRLQNKQKQLEVDQQIEAQRRIKENANRPQELPNPDQFNKPSQKSDENPFFDDWLKVAVQRMGLYPDFEKVVFSSEVPITNDMVRLMTSSPLAADIAYYLATHKYESLAISKMNLAQAARAIDQIEVRLKKSKLP